MHYGVSYYPEHKTPEELQHDLALLIESGINTVRMGEFAWCRFEPRPGEYHFEWLDPVVEALGSAGIRTIICTPTACPPAWLVELHPDLLYMDGRGVRRPFGGRRHYCYNNEAYRTYSAKITEQIAIHYGQNPYVAGFQIDNEPAQEGTGRCCCPVCTEAFRAWVKEKYGTIAEYNRRSGAVFWSGEYDSFGQILPPVNQIEPGAQPAIRAHYENPTLRMDFEHFSSDSQIAYQDIQSRILKAHTGMPVTTNATGLATNSIDYYKSTHDLDVYAFDFYPGLRDARVDAFPYAFARGVKGGLPFWVLEFVSGGGHRLSGSGRMQPNPGALRQAVIHSLAHGAEMMLHFQFRTFPFGAEQLNYAIVDMDGIPRRRYREMCDTAALLKRLAPYENAAFPREAAILVNYESHWALRIKPVNDPLFSYMDFCGQMHRALAECGVTADVLSPEMDFSGYKLVVLPASIVLDAALRAKLTAFVESGGVLLGTFLTSVKNMDNVGYTEPLPAGLDNLFGVTVQEVEPVFAANGTDVHMALPGVDLSTHDLYWSELLGGTAEMVGRYAGGYKAGCGMLSRNLVGKGSAWYLGCGLPMDALTALLGALADGAGVHRAPFTACETVEVVTRVHEGTPIYYLFNFCSREALMPCARPVKDALTGETYSDTLPIAPHGFRLVHADG